MSRRTVFNYSLAVVLASTISSVAAAQVRVLFDLQQEKADDKSKHQLAAVPSEKPSECCAGCAKADKLTGTWFRETPVGDITAR